MFDTSFRWTLLKIGIITFSLLWLADFLFTKFLGLFLPPDNAVWVARLLITFFVMVYLVIHPKYTSLRYNKIIDDLTDSEHKSFLNEFAIMLITFGLFGFLSPDRFGIFLLFEIVFGICLYSISSGRLQIREKGVFTQFGLFSWETIESYESNVLGIVFRQKGWKKFFPVLIKVEPWQRSKLEKYLKELNPYIKS